jgi:DNA polymerase V
MYDDLQAVADGDGVSVHTGFPNPALDHRGQEGLSLDLNRLLVQRPSSTYLFRIAGHHWADQGIYDGDVAVIDRAVQAKANDLIISWRASGSAICKQHQLTPEDKPWGVVTAIIHQYR